MSGRPVIAIAVVGAALAALALGERLWPPPVPPPAPVVEVRPVPVKPPDDPRCPCPPGTTQNRSWWPNGQLRRDVPYHDGVPEGLVESWYPDGGIECRSPHRDGRLHGIDRCWHSNGKLKSEVRFDMDHAVGIGRFWDDRGRLVKSRDYAKDPLPIPESRRSAER
jgi:hypothetical protein